MTRNVRILGDGVAARCCAHLLTQSGSPVMFERTGRPRVPAIMIGPSAQALMREVFDLDDLFRDLPHIERRIVAWGPNASPVELGHSAVTISEEILLHRLPISPLRGEEPNWTVYSAAPLPDSVVQHSFGSRMAWAVNVELKAGVRPNACWIESLESGWLFLISGWLMAVGGRPEELLGGSRVIAELVSGCGAASRSFPASPRIASPLGGDQWIACGSAAMGFDPLCGDGTAHAVREAILAAAVIRAVEQGGNTQSLVEHFEARLTAGFERHLVQCRQFYMSGGTTPWWLAQVDSVDEGLAWCRNRIARHGGFRYRLNGLVLEPLQPKDV